MKSDAAQPLLHASVYDELRGRFIGGRISPGTGLSTRTLALELGVSQMPVRDALSRLAAEGAVSIRSKRKIEIPPMTADRFDDLLACRLLLEPEAAALAMERMTSADIETLRAYDETLDRAISERDVRAYTEANRAFHFTLYRAAARPTLDRLIETLWLQFGPFMGHVYERYPETILADQHRIALDALDRRDEVAVRAAIAQDIRDGMTLIARSALARDA